MKRLLVPASAFALLWCAALASTGHREAEAAPLPSPQAPEVTFSNQVVRIFQNRCQVCHHPDDIAPFSLMTYADALPYAEQIKEKTQSREMPPWTVRPGCEEFEDSRYLSEEELATLAAWVDSGAPEGDPADMPEPLVFNDDWKLGEPDVVLANAPHGYKVPADLDDDIFQCFSVPTNFTVDRYLTAIEIRPGTRATVHHVLLFLDVEGQSVELDRAYPGPGYECEGGAGFNAPVLLSWNPGARAVTFPEGVGVLIPKGSRIVMQVHYSSGYEKTVDKTVAGLHFARAPVSQGRYVMQPRNESFVVPAGDPAYTDHAMVTLSEDVTLNSITPHQHRLGTDIRVDAFLPDGSSRCLIGVNWNAHWQGTYIFKNPVHLPAGTRVEVTGVWDNSDSNPNQLHHPPIDIPWGRESFHEMLFAFLGYTRDGELLTPVAPSLSSVRVAGSKLVVEGAEIHEGALIEVNGAFLLDTRAKAARSRALSSGDWRKAIPKGVEVRVAVVNPDGGRSETVSFTR